MHELEKRLQTAMDHAAPDALDQILSSCDTQKGAVISMTYSPKKRTRWGSLAVAAVFAVMLCGGFGLRGWNNAHAVASVVSLDVNPSIQLQVNAREKVLSAQALNAEAREVLGDMDLTGAHLNVAVNAIVGSLLQNGYLDSLSSAILISVEDKDSQRAARLETALTAEVDAALQHAAAGAAILSQVVEKDKALETQAQSSSISVGKAAMIEKVRTINPGLTFEALSALTVEELKQLVESGAPDLPIGTAAAADAAKEAAVPAMESKFSRTFADSELVLDVDPELDENPPHYEVEVKTKIGSLDYDVHAYTGEVLSGFRAAVPPAEKPKAETPATPQPVQPKPTEPVTPSAAPETAAPTHIGKDAAVDAALRHAGISAGEVRRVECELDRDDGKTVYEIDFKSGGREYEYEVDAFTGAILRAESEYDD